MVNLMTNHEGKKCDNCGDSVDRLVPLNDQLELAGGGVWSAYTKKVRLNLMLTPRMVNREEGESGRIRNNLNSQTSEFILLTIRIQTWGTWLNNLIGTQCAYNKFTLNLSPIIDCIDFLNMVPWIIIFSHHNALGFSPEPHGNHFSVGRQVT